MIIYISSIIEEEGDLPEHFTAIEDVVEFKVDRKIGKITVLTKNDLEYSKKPKSWLLDKYNYGAFKDDFTPIP